MCFLRKLDEVVQLAKANYPSSADSQLAIDDFHVHIEHHRPNISKRVFTDFGESVVIVEAQVSYL
jgi:hypothetical protein